MQKTKKFVPSVYNYSGCSFVSAQPPQKTVSLRGSSTAEAISQSSRRLPHSVNHVLNACEASARSDIAEQIPPVYNYSGCSFVSAQPSNENQSQPDILRPVELGQIRSFYRKRRLSDLFLLQTWRSGTFQYNVDKR
jgi:hypothetical protein